ncbi:sensor histidine kinase [Natrinema sp. 1APR25-10V2]|uniref:sensor histidine kinase n=1 Tax=Natrinema sp. 1APR25-10V2 TaxID=2951081 RepID=UPI002875D002|nr:sensor histidine kinase [Natrinema sp. 1APR25-10V2]MDS0473432.1 sensor histidine kinase [Natrinema sp. 1APR25-10V2]
MGVRLRTKFVIVVVAITLVVSGSVYVALESYKSDAVAEERVRTNETATLVADQIDASIWDHRDHVGLVASRPQARQFNESGQFLDSFVANSRFYAAQTISPNGTVVDFRGDISAEQRQSVIGSDRNQTPYVQRALRGETYVSDAEYVPRANKSVLVFSAPILNGSAVEGAIVAAMYLDRQTIFRMLPPLETSSQTVEIVGDGEVLDDSDQTFADSVQSSSTIESTGWQVTVTQDRTALNDRLRELATFQALILGLVLAVMLGFGYWQYSVSLRQTERLLDGFSNLGDGNYDYSVSLSGGTEWEQMSDGFNELADTLHERETELRKRQQRLEVLYRVLQHNLRNRISVILNYADVIDDETTNETVRDAAQTILDTGWEVTNLSQKARQINNAIEADLDRKPIELTSLVSDVVADLREAHPRVSMTTSLPDTAWGIALPSFRLAIENVCENACEHNDSAEPWVEVAITILESTDAELDGDESDVPDENGNWVRVTVADNGPGIPEQDRAAITEGRETALEHGSGLGLWLAYWIVDNSGGELRFADNDPRGSIVTIDIPRAPPAERDEVSTPMRLSE